jgi:hypothetical protein
MYVCAVDLICLCQVGSTLSFSSCLIGCIFGKHEKKTGSYELSTAVAMYLSNIVLRVLQE